MEFVKKMEDRFATWHSKVPHLPAGIRDWLANNVWWLALLVVVLSIFGVATIFLIFAFGSALIAIVTGIALGTAVLGGLAVAAVIVLIALGFWFVIITITAFAIPSLKAKHKKGWTLLFVALLLSIVMLLSAFIFTFEIFSLITGLLVITLLGYLLFEIRDAFILPVGVPAAEAAPEVIPPASSDEETK